MRVLVATSEGQGTQPGDYCWTVEGEIVLTGPLLECADPHRCGCGRGFPGLGSARATTTATVVDRAGISGTTCGEPCVTRWNTRGGSRSSTSRRSLRWWPRRRTSSRGPPRSSPSVRSSHGAVIRCGNAPTSPHDDHGQSGEAPFTSPRPSDLYARSVSRSSDALRQTDGSRARNQFS